MRDVFFQPGNSMLLHSTIRPEGVFARYRHTGGAFISAFDLWLEERPQQRDSKLWGTQVGWVGTFGNSQLKMGASYFDYQNIKGYNPEFGNDLLINEAGNSLDSNNSYAYDYDIAQLFLEASAPFNGLRLRIFANYSHNLAAPNHIANAHSVGLIVGDASILHGWEASLLSQKVDKDALFGQWTHADFGGGVTDSSGLVYQAKWRSLQKMTVDVTYFDNEYRRDRQTRVDYKRWQLDFNFAF